MGNARNHTWKVNMQHERKEHLNTDCEPKSASDKKLDFFYTECDITDSKSDDESDKDMLSSGDTGIGPASNFDIF